MKTALDQLDRIPAEDFAALHKMRAGKLPIPQDLFNPVIVVVDMVEAFVRDSYPTGWGDTGEPCAREIAELLKVARAHGVQAIYTVSEKFENLALIGEWRRGELGKQVPPFVLAQPAHQIVSEIAPQPGDIVLAKAKPSAFYGTQLSGVLNALGAHSVIVVGMTTSGCIRATVLDAFNLNYHTVIPINCVADRAQLSHQVNLFDMGAKYGDVVTGYSLLEAIEALPA